MRISPVPPCDGEGGAQIGFVQGHGLDACALMTKEAIAPIATPAQDTRIPHSMPIEIKMPALRSAERRVGQACDSTCSYRCSQYYSKKTITYTTDTSHNHNPI